MARCQPMPHFAKLSQAAQADRQRRPLFLEQTHTQNEYVRRNYPYACHTTSPSRTQPPVRPPSHTAESLPSANLDEWAENSMMHVCVWSAHGQRTVQGDATTIVLPYNILPPVVTPTDTQVPSPPKCASFPTVAFLIRDRVFRYFTFAPGKNIIYGK